DQAVFWQPADGSRPAERLAKPSQGSSHVPETWSSSGNPLLFSVAKDSKFSLWSIRIPDKVETRVGDLESLSPFGAMFSPDGRWFAYMEGDAGAAMISVFVQPFPLTGASYHIDRGFHPIWSADGNELFFTLRLQPRVVSVTTKPTIAFG